MPCLRESAEADNIKIEGVKKLLDGGARARCNPDTLHCGEVGLPAGCKQGVGRVKNWRETDKTSLLVGGLSHRTESEAGALMKQIEAAARRQQWKVRLELTALLARVPLHVSCHGSRQEGRSGGN